MATRKPAVPPKAAEPRAPKLRDLSLTATERTAVTAVMQARQALAQQQARLEQEMAEIGGDIERRLRLPIGALGEKATHQVNLDEMRVEEIPPNKEKPPSKRASRGAA